MSVVERLTATLAGRYTVEREIGRGGMATVFLARDVRHRRNVALKLLSPELGAILGAERFLSEIQVTANLQHPNLLPLFDSGEADGLLFYVMPYVEGESLRARLDREKQLPVNEAVSIAVAIAGALDYAHRQGVIHRDLKPENILLHEGQPLVADFGIALAVKNAGGNRITQTGLSLGTPQYMSPEQATGDRAIDGRTDIYSLGAILYEMLVGDPPYLGGTSQAVIAKVLTERPRNVRLGRPAVPEHVDAAVERALEKLPADRFATAHEFADALQGRLTLAGSGAAGSRAAVTNARTTWRTGSAVAAVMASLALGVLAGAKLLAPKPAPPAPIRFSIATGFLGQVVGLSGATLDISNDGSVVALVNDPSRRIHVRRMNELTLRVLEGTERASFPAFSPDGRWIAYVTATGVSKVSTDGGPPQQLTQVRIDGLTWPLPDRILATREGGLEWLSVSGEVTPLARRDSAGIAAYQWARMLADGKTIIFAASPQDNPGSTRLGVMQGDGRNIQLLDLRLYNVFGMIDEQLIYLSDTRSIMAIRFDVAKRKLIGAPVLLVENVSIGGFGAMRAALSKSGTLVYEPSSGKTRLALAGRGDTLQELSSEMIRAGFPRYSPDGRKIAVTVGGETTWDVWVLDVPSHTLQRLTTDGGDRPEWSPDGRRVIFRRDFANGEQMWWQAADGGAPAEPLQTIPATVPEAVVSPDGKYLVYRVNSPVSGRDLWFRALSGDTTPRPIAVTKEDELMPRLSPNGKWLAFVSTASGIREVYVQPFPGPGGVLQVSSGGGDEPLWSADGRRVIYRNPPAFIAATMMLAGDRMGVSSRAVVHEGVYSIGGVHPSWDIAPDGRLLVLRPSGESNQIVVIHNFRTELNARLAGTP